MHFEHDVVVVGGCGHVGLPLGLAFAARGLDVVLYDTSFNVIGTLYPADVPTVSKLDSSAQLLKTNEKF